MSLRDLTFCTTSVVKLAHARYIAEGRQVSIKSFRQRTYHADYDEPRSTSREAILQGSYRSACAQIEKAGFSLKTHAFVLEDTSVRIDALSVHGEEVPGVDIKFWMQEQTFARLDEALRTAGNARTATVRSDVLLHVPEALAKAWGVTDPFIVFVGVQSGVVVNHETEFTSNPVFPWLDNQSFNKWFQPDGMHRPFGALPIQQADAVDFRRKSFGAMFDFLESRKFLQDTRIAAQPSLPQTDDKNIILCGFTCAGKTIASQHLARKYGYLHVEASDFMYLSYYRRHGFKGDVTIGDFAENALVQKPEIAAEKVAEYIVQNAGQPIVISGFRAPNEISYILKRFADAGLAFQPAFVDATQAIRFERMKVRARLGDDADRDDFNRRDEQQVRMGLQTIADTVGKIGNNEALSGFLTEIEKLVGDRTPKEIDIDVALLRVQQLTDVPLHDAILVALLRVWRDDESREFHTTTNIAKKLIADAFPNLSRRKHKDNVSRYFNQDFYAFYELHGSASARKYRLSNTGYGMAVQTLRRLVSQTWS